MYGLKLLSHYGIEPKTLLHIGAHAGKEAATYKAAGIEHVVFVEAIPEIFARLEKNLEDYPDYVGFNAVCSDVVGQPITFNVSSNNGGSSSFLGLGNHAKIYPQIHYVEELHLITETADHMMETNFPEKTFDMMVLDTQGAEMHVLRGATKLLQSARTLWIEISESPLYEGGCTFEEVTAYVATFGFKLRYVQLGPELWGDGLYVRP
jgi:FkbM family methyltransferase